MPRFCMYERGRTAKHPTRMLLGDLRLTTVQEGDKCRTHVTCRIPQLPLFVSPSIMTYIARRHRGSKWKNDTRIVDDDHPPPGRPFSEWIKDEDPNATIADAHRPDVVLGRLLRRDKTRTREELKWKVATASTFERRWIVVSKGDRGDRCALYYLIREKGRSGVGIGGVVRVDVLDVLAEEDDKVLCEGVELKMNDYGTAWVAVLDDAGETEKAAGEEAAGEEAGWGTYEVPVTLEAFCDRDTAVSTVSADKKREAMSTKTDEGTPRKKTKERKRKESKDVEEMEEEKEEEKEEEMEEEMEEDDDVGTHQKTRKKKHRRVVVESSTTEASEDGMVDEDDLTNAQHFRLSGFASLTSDRNRNRNRNRDRNGNGKRNGNGRRNGKRNGDTSGDDGRKRLPASRSGASVDPVQSSLRDRVTVAVETYEKDEFDAREVALKLEMMRMRVCRVEELELDDAVRRIAATAHDTNSLERMVATFLQTAWILTMHLPVEHFPFVDVIHAIEARVCL